MLPIRKTEMGSNGSPRMDTNGPGPNEQAQMGPGSKRMDSMGPGPNDFLEEDR